MTHPAPLLPSLPSALALGLLLAASASAQTITVALNADIRSINPGVNRDDNSDTVLLHAVEGLVGLRENGRVAPLLAQEVSLSKDGLSYTFKLRKGVKFHNGAPLTAQDVLWNWKRYLDPKTEWRCLPDFDGRMGAKVETVAALDTHTVVIKLNKPAPLFLDSLARTDCAMVAILHKDSVNADGSFRSPIGTGPFKLDEWKRGEHVRLTRFADYVSPPGTAIDGYVGSKRPLVEAVKFMVVPDSATIKAALISGAIDTAEVMDSDMPELAKHPNVEVRTNTTATKHSLLLQTRDPLLSKPQIRRAIAHAIDMPQLVAAVSNGLGQPNASLIHAASPYYSATQKQGYGYNPALARKLLQEAGYQGEKIKLITNKRPARPSFNIALITQQMLQAVGLNVELEVLEWATQLDRFHKGNYQMMAFSMSARLDPALSYEQVAGPKDTQPRKVWETKEALALIDRSMAESDEAERGRLFDQIHQRFLSDVPMVMIYNHVDVNAQSRRLVGYTPWVASKPRLWEVKVQAR